MRKPGALAICLAIVGLVVGAATSAARVTVPGPPLRFGQDTYSFANQTVYIYPHGYAEKRHLAAGEKAPAFTLHCFAMCRSTEQFRKFARFDPALPPPDDATLEKLVHRINRRAAWRAPLPSDRRVVIPGYANLYALSQAKPFVLQQRVGGGLSTYVRPGNYRMFWFWWNGPSEQERTQRTLEDVLSHNDLFVAYLTTYPKLSINHAVLIYGHRPATAKDKAEGIIRYYIYDPNHPEAPREMVYDQKKCMFSYQKDWDFVGGKVIVLQAYGFWLQ